MGVKGPDCEYSVLVNLGSAVLCTTISDPISASPGRESDEVVCAYLLCESCMWELLKVELFL